MARICLNFKEIFMTDELKSIEEKAHQDLISTEGWVKTHTALAIGLACFVIGAICGYLIHTH
jgi:hypothetical protein